MKQVIDLLIVEDNPDDLFFIEKALKVDHFTYSVIKSGTEAYEYLKEGKGTAQVVLLDYMLPGMNGLEILEALGPENRNYAFIFLSIDNSIDIVVEAMKRGALDFVVKSTSLKHELSDKVRKVFDLHMNRLEKKRMENELKEAKAEAEQNELKYRTLVDAVYDSVVVTENGVIVEVNSRAVEQSGYSYETLIGKKALDYIQSDNPALSSDPAGQEWRNIEAKVQTERGELKTVIINSRIAELRGKNVVISSIHDITESRILEEKLRQSEKMNAIGQLAGGIAHDFNNQLSPIIGYADMLSHKLENPQYRKFANNILHSAIRSAELTKKLLSFARKGQIILEPIDINEMINRILDNMSQELPSFIEIECRLGRLCNIIKGDPNQMEQALRNLIENGIEAMSEGGTLTVETQCVSFRGNDELVQFNHLEPGDYIKILIRDTGWGIPDELKKNIFEPFFTTKDIGEGSGMGLAAAYGAVAENDGYITFSSEEGIGTTFVIYLPYSRPRAAGQFDTKEYGKPRESRILIVDDEKMLRNMLEDILAGDNHSIISCSSGLEALEKFEELYASIDLVILDMVMPEMDGMETFLKMKNLDPKVKVLVSSGYHMKKELRKMRDAGAAGFLKKPYKINELRKQLRKILG